MATMHTACRLFKRISLLAVIPALSSTSAGCKECDVTEGLYEPYVEAYVHPERYDSWVAQHPGYFTRERIDCINENIREAFERELEELRECDRWASDVDLFDVCRRGVSNPENAAILWAAIVAAGQGQIAFSNTGVGRQLISLKAEDPVFWLSITTEVLNALGPEIREELKCEECSGWLDIF